MATEIKNFCRKGTMHTCNKKDCPKSQKDCSYYDRASETDRCMCLRMGFHCDNLDAQNRKLENKK